MSQWCNSYLILVVEVDSEVVYTFLSFIQLLKFLEMLKHDINFGHLKCTVTLQIIYWFMPFNYALKDDWIEGYLLEFIGLFIGIALLFSLMLAVL